MPKNTGESTGIHKLLKKWKGDAFMKRVTVILSVVLVLMFAMASTSLAKVHCPYISHVKMKLLSQDHYTWELTKDCDIKEPVTLPAGESVNANYEVTATRSEPQTIRTVEISANVTGIDKVEVVYNKESHTVDVVDGKIRLELPYVDGANGVTVKSGNTSVYFYQKPLPTGTKESINATATLYDQFDPAPKGFSYDFSGEFEPQRELDDPGNNTYVFEYTVTVKNQSSYGETYTLGNEASIVFEEGDPLVETASFEIITPDKPEEQKLDIPKRKEPKAEPEPLLPQTHGGHGVLGLVGVLMTAAGILVRRFK